MRCMFLGAILLATAANPGGVVELGAACIDCHGEIVASWRASPMARAVRALDPKELDGLVPVVDPRTGFTYRLERRGERGFVVEEWRAKDGTELAAARNEAELVFAIGAGVMDTSYVASRGEMLWFAPLEVLSANATSGRHAALAPGQQVAPGVRFSVPIQEECLACHTDALPRERFPLNLVPDADWTPRGVDCAHCHPGSQAHVEHHAKNASGPDPLLAVAPPDPLERVSSCARCHLQGDARIALDEDLSFARRPGGDLLAKLAVFTGSDANGEIPFVGQVERMVESRCFTASLERGERAMTCETCHDPHRSVFEARERAHAREACVSCHAAGDERVADRDPPCSLAAPERGAKACVDCHTRRTAPFDVAGVEVFDHRIERKPLAPSKIDAVRMKQSNGGPLTRFRWPGRTPPLDGDPGLALMASVVAGQPARAQELVDVAPAPAVERLSVFHHLRGGLLEAVGRADDARKAYARALLLDPKSAATRVNLGLVLAQCNRAKEGLAQLDAVLATYPRSDGALRNRALVKLALGDSSGARADLETAHALLPNAATARGLAELARRSNDRAAAERWLAAARALDPTRE
ncbi:MAG: hypothetical protein K8S98_00685 [Planctomycetes bacterium]|nr:hypothetical protein [Planctomycetota bacterium]